VSGWDKLAAQLNHARTVGPTASTQASRRQTDAVGCGTVTRLAMS